MVIIKYCCFEQIALVAIRLCPIVLGWEILLAGKRLANPTVGQLHYKMAHQADGRDTGALTNYQPPTCNDSEMGWE